MEVDKTNSSEIIEKNISYYNEVAPTYNLIMDAQESNQVVRESVKAKFLKEVPEGLVLDFGGGTGLDLPWLSEKYDVMFCEPSHGMYEEAIKMIRENDFTKNVTVLESWKTDFRSWDSELPFDKPVDAILANFGVLNYIPDLKLLFKNLAGLIKPRGVFIILVLELDFRKRAKWHRKNAIISLLSRSTFTMHIPYRDQKQRVFVHTANEIEKACHKYFTCVSNQSLEGYDFTLIHLVRK